MKKIYTITFHSVLNHGAALQTFALQKYLASKGHDAILLNYIPTYFAYQTLRPAKGIRKTLLKYSRLVKFIRFSKQHIKKTDLLLSKASLNKLPRAHAVVCGSDQIWNPKLTNNHYDKAFFLDFVTFPTTKIAYAASAGGYLLSNAPIEIQDMVARFDAIGVRESHLCEDIISKKIHPDAHFVADPTLLISDYSSIIDDRCTPRHEYIATYEVSSNTSRELLSKHAESLKAMTGLPVYHLGDKAIPAATKNLLNISPAQWVSLIKSAKYVITNSFHGCAFAMNHEKQFIYVPHVEEEKNARPYSLLNKVGLESKVAREPNSTSIIFEKYDLKLLTSFIKESQKFLDKSIKITTESKSE